MVKGRAFSHDAALTAGRSCSQCHTEITRGDGAVPKDQCYFCHVDRAEKFSDVKFVHEKHVAARQIDCLWCHEKIVHGKLKMAEHMPMVK